jgi:tripartite-type tricarboxylate transporter receptor subunit TctC
LVAGQIDYLCGNLSAAIGRITSKQEKVLAVLSRDRTPLTPELRTAHEQGLEGMDITTWTAFFLPKGAPRAIVDKPSKITHEAWKRPPSRPVCTTSGDRH